MTLIELIELLHKAQVEIGPSAPVLLCFEPGAMESGYDEKATEGISDVRLVDDWPLPGKSLVTHEGDKPKKLILFYDNHCNLDSSLTPLCRQPMSYQSANKAIMDAFEQWWHFEGSGMAPLPEEAQVTHVKRISAIAWSNGAYANGLYDRLDAFTEA